jgi:cytochrome c556
LFRLLGWLMQPLYPMARGLVPYDEQRLALTAGRLQQLSPLIPELFQSDTHLAEVATVATPNIWTELGDFDAKADDLTAAADALASATAEHDREAASKAIVQISKACYACHIVYTQTKK